MLETEYIQANVTASRVIAGHELLKRDKHRKNRFNNQRTDGRSGSWSRCCVWRSLGHSTGACEGSFCRL